MMNPLAIGSAVAGKVASMKKKPYGNTNSNKGAVAKPAVKKAVSGMASKLMGR